MCKINGRYLIFGEPAKFFSVDQEAPLVGHPSSVLIVRCGRYRKISLNLWCSISSTSRSSSSSSSSFESNQVYISKLPVSVIKDRDDDDPRTDREIHFIYSTAARASGWVGEKLVWQQKQQRAILKGVQPVD